MRELMSHTAGFGYGLCGDDPVNAAFRDTGVLTSANLDEMMTKIEGHPADLRSGHALVYSASVDIQGYIVQKLSGQKFGDYLKANIFTPLGMNDTSFFVTEANKPRFADVYHWDKDKKALVKNEAVLTVPASPIRTASNPAAAASSRRRTTMRASPRCSSTRARSPATPSSSRKRSS
jgi:CubicO group peptidase (beta-lactamase class C family)